MQLTTAQLYFVWLIFSVCFACAGRQKKQVTKKEKKNRRGEDEGRKKVTKKTKKEHKRKKDRHFLSVDFFSISIEVPCI